MAGTSGSQKQDLIIMISIQANRDGMVMSQIEALQKKLWRKRTDHLSWIYQTQKTNIIQADLNFVPRENN